MIRAKIKFTDWNFSGRDLERVVEHDKLIKSHKSLLDKSIYGKIDLRLGLHGIYPTSIDEQSGRVVLANGSSLFELKSRYVLPPEGNILNKEPDSRIGKPDLYSALVKVTDALATARKQLKAAGIEIKDDGQKIALKDGKAAIKRYQNDYF